MTDTTDAVSATPGMSAGPAIRWVALIALAAAQFVMVLDQSVMNVSISTLVVDFDTTVTTIQAVITLYCLVMAMFMLTGAKVGDIIGRRRAFVVGLVIYGCGSLVTALAPTVAVLTLGWSVLEGLGASLVLPALAALIAGNFTGASRKVAYAVIGGVAGAGIAVGPILGGWATTELTWRAVFAGEVVLVVFILAMTGKVDDAERSGPKPRLDYLGAVLSAVGLGVIVLGTLQSSTWGWVVPKASPITPLGFSLTIWMIAGGAVLLWAFTVWQRHREKTGADPLVHLSLLRIPPLRSGLAGLFGQNLILMGVFFVVPLYLQLVLGLNALQTGIKMLPISITMFLAAAAGSRLSTRFTVRGIVRAGLTTTVLAILILLATVQPELRDAGFAVSMAILGIGMGLIASQLGNVVQSSVDASGRGEAGGLQYTGQQLGSSLGVALIGAIVLTGLTSGFVSTVEADPRITAEVSAQVGVAVENGIDFVSADQVHAAADQAGLDPATTTAIAQDYSQAQLGSLKVGLLTAALLALLALMSTRNLPHDPPTKPRKQKEPALAPSST
ncbi:MFS transporter [Pseudonocardia sp. RS11V-5]|uniref:MFS transporter n=1 Tax=Pseudonocardia terrae TaxID=2905831 RepID=UPI001E4B0A17|nr:MFS transporter [Pseudonocardia terrae]MCE3553142.1 MFS transporter [Pseudonocardia terrae]